MTQLGEASVYKPMQKIAHLTQLVEASVEVNARGCT